jgi:hypothetical protein
MSWPENGENPNTNESQFIPGFSFVGEDWRTVSSQPIELKVCDLCGSPNLRKATECQVCRWHGHFSATDNQAPLEVRLLWPEPEFSEMHGWIGRLRRRFSRFWAWLIGE